MGFVFDEITVKDVPKIDKVRTIEVSLVSGQINDRNRPLGNISVQFHFVKLEVKGLDSGKNFDRISIPRLAFKLPGRSLDKDSDNSIPVLMSKFSWIINDSKGD